MKKNKNTIPIKNSLKFLYSLKLKKEIISKINDTIVIPEKIIIESIFPTHPN